MNKPITQIYSLNVLSYSKSVWSYNVNISIQIDEIIDSSAPSIFPGYFKRQSTFQKQFLLKKINAPTTFSKRVALKKKF